jgi:hypothetical protein
MIGRYLVVWEFSEVWHPKCIEERLHPVVNVTTVPN